MKHRLLILLLLLPIAFACNPVTRMRVASVAVETIRPSGLSSAQADIVLNLANSGPRCCVSDLKAVVQFDGTNLISVSADDFIIAARCDSSYRISVRASLDSGLKLYTIPRLLQTDEKSAYKVNISARLGSGPKNGRVVVYKTDLESLWKKLR